MAQAGFTKALQDREEVTITVMGRRSGREIKFPVWFGVDGKTLTLVPIHGSRSQWYKNLIADPTITVRAGRQEVTGKGRPTQERAVVQRVLEQFRKKYTARLVAQYYDHPDAIVEVPIEGAATPGRPGPRRRRRPGSSA